MKKKNIFYVIVGVIIILISIFSYFNHKYTTALYANWSIKLSNQYNEVYSVNSGPSFHGDGERFHVFEYKKESDIDHALDWKTNKNTIVENSVIQILDDLNTEDKYIVDFNQTYKYYEKHDSDGSSLYLILINNLLYVVEDFY